MQAGQKVRYLAPLPAAGTRGENLKNKRADLETLTHATTCSKRNDHLHNSCIEMLMNGFHSAYTEVFNLVSERKRVRIAAGPGSEMSLEVVLEENPTYIDKLKFHLCEAERGNRAKKYEDVYQNISQLAVYFDNENLDWLAHHFYTKALEVAHHVRLDSGKSLSEASERCGLAAEKRGDLASARLHLEEALKISKGRSKWSHSGGITWHQQSSRHLSRVLCAISNDLSDEAALDLLPQAVLAADESQDQLSIAQAYYQYGTIQFNSKQYDAAQASLSKALKNAIATKNEKLIQLLTTRLANLARVSTNGSERFNNAKEYLLLAVEQIKDEVESSVDALCQVALLYNAHEEYESAEKSIQKAYLACGQAGRREVSTRVSCGTIGGNILFPQMRKMLAQCSKDRSQISQMVKWKNSANSEFLKPPSKQ